MMKNTMIFPKILSIVLGLAMLFGMIQVSAFAAEETAAGLAGQNEASDAEQTPGTDFSKVTYVAFGDSITYGVDGNYRDGPGRIMENPYPKLVGQQLGFRTVNNRAVSGGTLCADSGRTNMTERILSFNGRADVISIMLGVNDYQMKCPMGDMDSTDNKTIYGSLHLICRYLTENYPDAFVFFMTPFQYRGGEKDRGAGYNLPAVAEAIKEVAASYQIPVLDMYTYGKYEEEFNDTSLPYQDGIHPSQQHHIQYTAPMIAEFITENYEGPAEDDLQDGPESNGRLIYSRQDLISGYCTKSGQVANSAVHSYFIMDAAGIQTITITPPDAPAWNPYDIYYIVIVEEDGTVCCYGKLDKQESTVIELGGKVKGTVYFNAFYDDHPEYVYVKEATVVVHEHTCAAVVTEPTCTQQGYTTHTCECGESFVDSYVDATGHTYENGICSGCSSTATPYLQQLPETISGCSNLYDILTPSKGYYTATQYDTSNGAVLCVVIPVEPGDRIAASSFGPVSENMGSVDGIRVTYLLDGTIVKSLSADSVYTVYTQEGYLTVPEGVNMVSVPWWAPSDSNWLTLGQISKNFAAHSPKAVPAQAPTCTENGYTAGEICEICDASLGMREEVPATGHDYNGNTCTICGTVNVLAILDGKYVSVLGDSISTFHGYSNDATVNTTIGGNGPRYDAGTADTKPGSYCLLESVDDTWWMHFANRSGMKLLVNNSWAGSQVFGGQTSDGRLIPPAYLERCVNLHDNTVDNNPGNAPIDPDVIFVYLGINDYNFNRNNVGDGAVDYANLISSDGTYVTPTTFGEAYGILLHKMQKAYPNAQIFAMTLLPENLYSVNMTAWEQHNAYIRAAAEYYDVPLVDLAEKCAITWENYSGYMMDKIHPTTAGMELISDCIETELLAYYQENQPHVHSPVTDAAVAATCTKTGLTAGSHCQVCDEILVMQEVVPATGHIYENGVCTVCGAYIPGDINGDGKVNNKDATRLFQHLSGWEVEVVEEALDVNGDGKVNNKDATRLFQYLSGWNVEIHESKIAMGLTHGSIVSQPLSLGYIKNSNSSLAAQGRNAKCRMQNAKLWYLLRK